jgi:hypothetical protein
MIVFRDTKPFPYWPFRFNSALGRYFSKLTREFSSEEETEAFVAYSQDVCEYSSRHLTSSTSYGHRLHRKSRSVPQLGGKRKHENGFGGRSVDFGVSQSRVFFYPEAQAVPVTVPVSWCRPV